MSKEMGMSKDPMSKEMGMSDGNVGHLYMQTNEIQNAIIHYQRSANGTLTEVERVPRVAQVPGLSNRSAARKAHPTHLRAREASSSRRIGAFCSRPMAATIRFRASA